VADSITSINWRPTVRRRILIMASLFVIWATAIEARLVYLQVFQRDEMQKRADHQRDSRVKLPAKRGEILDREGRLLAYSVDADTICAYPTAIGDPAGTAAAVCAALDGCSVANRADLTAKLASQKQFAFVRHLVSTAEAQRVNALKLPGIGLMKESRRFYPNESLAAHLLGYVGDYNKGWAGIESAYDGKIRGREGTVFVQLDGRKKNREAYSRLEQPATAGATLELTIDRYLQYIVERELHAGVVENQAESGTAIVMNPMTGEILALASEPTFDPNQFGNADLVQQLNRAVQDLYEPGSTFKIVTASAAFEENVVSPTDLIDVSTGRIQFGSRVVEDTHRNGVLSFTDVLVKSSNVGAIKVGLKLGAERLGRFVRRFGFGTRASRDFPAENPGQVRDPAHWSDSVVASVSMGYQIGVTPLQMATAVSSIANGGELLEPRVVRATIEDGRRAEVARHVVRRTVTPATAALLTGIMEQVVERGTGTIAKIPGYPIAGKTGTAQRLIGGRYSHTEYNASFLGFLPARKPALTILVLINSPHGHGYFGGVVAAPVFKRIAEAAIRHLGIPPTVGGAAPVMVAEPRVPTPGIPIGPSRPAVTVVPATQVSITEGIVPDLIGLSGREAMRTLARLGLNPRLNGDGVVVEQDPPPGTPLEAGASCHLFLARLPSPPSGARQ
jgi:cell division protein FtsI (penicillin-binding protein 3)